MTDITDSARAISVEREALKKIKGHVRIELRDVTTGKVEVTEGHNNFQAGVLEDYMKSLGYFKNSPYDNGTWRSQAVWRNLVGGIFLFKNEIDDSNGEVPFMPAGNVMTANGAYGVTNSGNPLEMGSYNSIESVANANGITLVYDWDTSHGNGDISCISLTSETGGYIGYGNASGTSGSMRELRANQNYNDNENITSNKYTHAVYGNIIYLSSALDTTAKTLTLSYTTRGVTQASIFDGLTKSKVYNYTGEVTDTSANNGVRVLTVDGDTLYAFPYQNPINSGATYKYFKIDLLTDTMTVETLTNNTGGVLSRDAYDWFVYNGILYACRNTTGDNCTVFRIRLSDSVVLDSSLKTYKYYWHNISCLSEGLIMHIKDTGRRMYIYDTDTGTDYLANGYGTTSSGSFVQHGAYITDRKNAQEGIIVSGYSYNYNNVALVKNPLYLATIYNLQNTVTKTASQTMKVTYTLTEEEE